MKKLSIKCRLFTIFFALVLAFIGAGIILGARVNFAFADSSSSSDIYGEVFLPNDTSEIYGLSSPTDVLFFEGGFAISQNPNIVVIFMEGNYLPVVTITGASSLDQLKLLNNNTLLVLNFNTIYKISLVDYSFSILYDTSNTPITCTHYDTDGKYLVAGSSSEGSTRIYTINDNLVTRSDYTIDGINGNKPVRIDGENLIYVKNEKIYFRSITDLTQEPTLLIDANPDELIVGNDYIYYTLSGKIYKYNKLTSIITELTVKNTYENAEKYQLGFTNDLTNISLKGENLVVTSLVNNTIQEFRINGEFLEFTGFAISNNKTGYNRFLNTIDIEKSGEVVAVLDGLKLSLIKPNDNPYAYERFTNLFVDEKVKNFAIGDNGILYYTESKEVKYYNLTAKTDEDKITKVCDSISLADISFRFGKFYILSSDGLNTYFYTYNETTKELNKKDYSSPHFELVEVDVFNNIYYVDNGKLYLNDVEVCVLQNADKLQTDFAGNLFVLKEGKILKFDNNSKEFIDLNVNGTVTSFALSFDTKEVYYTLVDSEEIFVTKDLTNYSINSTELPSDFILSDTSANIEDLKIYSIKDNAVCFSVTTLNDCFNYKKLIDPLTHYAFICDLDYDGTIYKCLAGVNGNILVHESYLNEQEIVIEDSSDTVFITTTVHAYYLPLINLEGTHYLDSLNAKVILEKHTALTTLKKLNVSDRDFYYVCLDETNGIYAYVPLDFTVKTLAKDVVINEFTIEDFKSPTLYYDLEMTSEFTSFSEQTSLKVISIENGIAKILYSTEEGDIICYADASNIIDTPSIWVRNVLIILALVATVSGTTTYFLLRRRIKD